MISRFLLKHSRTWRVLLWSRCVSCRASIAILFSYMVLLIVLRFCRRDVFTAVAPLTFRVAMLILALLARSFLCWRCAMFSLGMGLSWCALWWFVVPLPRFRFPLWVLRLFRRGRSQFTIGVRLSLEGIALCPQGVMRPGGRLEVMS
jgi:hypothetical protein